jgi:hypothetical protein
LQVLGDAAAEHNDFRIKDAAHIRDGETEIVQGMANC